MWVAADWRNRQSFAPAVPGASRTDGTRKRPRTPRRPNRWRKRFAGERPRPTLLTRAAQPVAALGSNLLGAVLGGCLEYYSMLGGLKSTALMALVLYLGAYLWLRIRRAGNPSPSAGHADDAAWAANA